MKSSTKNEMFSSKVFDSRIRSANTTGKEAWLGYFAGPAMVYMVYYCVAGTYLTQFYTDVLGIGGIFMTLMPVFSKVFDAFTNIVMGRVIDKTRSRQGKARPWILISGVLMAITGILLYAIPKASYAVQIVWVIVSYNLFFALAFTIYNMSHALMVPLSTRNTKQRDTLALLTSTGATMIPGLLVTIIMPVLIRFFLGVGTGSQGNWLKMMSVLSIFAIPAVLLEYYFTKERVTEDSRTADGTEDVEGNRVTMGMQIKACLNDPYWLIIMGFNVLYYIFSNLSSSVGTYYCNWVLGNSIESGMSNQLLVNMIGQAPLGIGLIILWPLVRKFGKRRVMQFGFGIGAIGCLVILLNASNLSIVLAGLVIKSIGTLPTYVMMAQIAKALDHIEWKNKFRADGFSASIYSIILTVTAGVSQSIVLGGINMFGYIQPGEDVTMVINQPSSVKAFFIICFVGVPMVGYLIGSLLMIPFDVEKKIPQISADIIARHKAEAEARGEIYLSAEEKAILEQEENDRVAEINRIKELKEKCAKKGLDFQEEEAKYQMQLAAKKAKEEAKKARKKK